MRRERNYAMAATTVACDREEISHKPSELPSQETGRVLSARLKKSIVTASNFSQEKLFISMLQEGSAITASNPIECFIYFIYLFLVWFLLLVKKKVDMIQPSTCAHTHAERERERERAVDFGGEIIGPDDL
ncbi:unnamed protein product [Camellia sinensis]